MPVPFSGPEYEAALLDLDGRLGLQGPGDRIVDRVGAEHADQGGDEGHGD